jgi:hypothetical protein
MSEVFNNTKLRIEKNTAQIREITILSIIAQLYIIFTKVIEDYKEIKKILNLNLLSLKPRLIKYHLAASK